MAFLLGKSTISMAMFHCKLYVHRRVNNKSPLRRVVSLKTRFREARLETCDGTLREVVVSRPSGPNRFAATADGNSK